MPFNFNPGLFQLPNSMFGDSMDVVAQDPIMQDVGLEDTSLPDNRVPFDALSAMLGVSLPALPQRDAYGNYGITPEQNEHAGKQAFMSVLGDAGSMFMGGSPQIGTQTGQKASGIYDAALGKASALNVADYKLKLEAAQNEMNRIAKLSDAEKQQLLVEQETIKLKAMKDVQSVAGVWASEMESTAGKYIGMARAEDEKLIAQGMAPYHVDKLKGGLLQAKAAALKGDLGAADIAFEEAISNLPDVLQSQIKSEIANETIKASAKYGMQEEVLGNLKSLYEGSGITIRTGPNGEPVFMDQEDVAKEKAVLEGLQAEAALRRAQADKESSMARLSGLMKPKELAATTQKVFEAANVIATTDVSQLGYLPQTEQNKIKTKLNEAASVLQTFGFTPTPEGANEIINGGQEGVRARISQMAMQQMWMLNGGVGMPMMGQPAPTGQPAPSGVTFAAARGLASRAINSPDEARNVLRQITTSTDPLVRQALAGLQPTGDPVSDLALIKQALNPAQ